jgi:hypothetical protein
MDRNCSILHFVFCQEREAAAKDQALAALIWVGYGFMIGAMPVAAANRIVATAAIYSAFSAGRADLTDA